jgi:hypothetical protein
MGMRRPPGGDDLGFEEIGFQETPDPKKISTRAQAQAVAEKEDAGGLEAGPWYMDAIGDVLNPVDFAAGAATGGLRAAGEGVQALAKGATRPLAAAGERQTAINLIKNPAKLEPYARGLVEDAAGKMSERIGQKEDALRALIKGKQGEINPDLVSEVMPQYGQKLAERRRGMVPDGVGGMVEKQLDSGRVPVDLDSMLRVKRVGDKLKNYAFSDAQNPQVVARAKNASNVSDVARRQIYENAPGSEEILSQMGGDIRLKNFLTKRGGKNPVSTIMTTPGSMRDSVVAQVDEAAGSNLRNVGKNLRQAKEDLIEPMHFVRPLQLPAEIAKTGKRAAIAAGSAANSALNSVGKIPGMGVASQLGGYAAARDMVGGTRSASDLTPQNDDMGFEELGFEELPPRRGR